MDKLTGKPAQIIYAVPFGVFGLFHFMSADAMAGLLAGWPAAVFLVYLSGAGFLAATIAIIVGKYAKLACYLLALELLLIVLGVHLPGLFNPETMQMAMPGVLKDTSLLGSALVIAGLVD